MDIVDTKIAESQKEFKSAIDRLIKVMMLNLKFETDNNGGIIPNIDNLNKIVNIDSIYESALVESGYTDAVDSFLDKESDILEEMSNGN